MINYDSVKKSLEAKLRELVARAEGIEDDLNQPGDSDWGEHAIETEDDEVQASIGEATVHDIQEIKLALSRIESGHYDECTSCGNKIPEARLNVLPFATTCVNCA